MKKILIAVVIIIPLVYLSMSKQVNKEQIELNEEQEIAPSLVPKAVTQKVRNHQKEIIQKALPKKLTEHSSFKPFMDKQAGLDKNTVIDKSFLKNTFTTLMDCYKDGCGEKADHDGYYNEAQTAAMLSLNQVLRETLEDHSQSSWLQEKDLLELFQSPNKNTRDLSFKHMMKRGDPQAQLSKIIDNTAKLDDYNYSDTINNVIDHIDDSNIDQFVSSVVNTFENKNANARIETLFAFVEKKVQLDNTQWESIAKSACSGLKDTNNKEAYRNLTNEIAVNSGLTGTIEETCQE